jgi:TPR repeat protein
MPLDCKDKIFIGTGLVLALLWYDVHRREQQEYGDERHVVEVDEEQKHSSVAVIAPQERSPEPGPPHAERETLSDPNAEFDKGMKAFWGDGVQRSNAEALRGFRTAAEHGHAEAQNYLGMLYGRGRDVQRNYEEAAKWYRQAANHHYALAQFNLGVFHQNGWGVIKDEAEAVR